MVVDREVVFVGMAGDIRGGFGRLACVTVRDGDDLTREHLKQVTDLTAQIESLKAVLERVEAELMRRATDTERRVDLIAASIIPAAAYEERSRSTADQLTSVRTAVTAETEARKAAIAEMKVRLDAEAASRSAWVKWLAGGVVGALGVQLVDLLRSAGAG